MTEQPRPVSILLVEDNPVDAELAKRALSKGEKPNPVTIASDGQEALDVLAGLGPLPGLIVLDLNLPKLNGLEVLEQIKNSPLLRSIPVIMLTTSDRVEDITRSYEAGANGYVCKPLLFEDYSRVVDSIRQFWTETAQLPRAG
jgi:CheY-like chemotaxis protein